MHSSQSAGTTPYINEVEVEVQALYESEEALLRPDTGIVYALRRGDQGKYGIGVFVSLRRVVSGTYRRCV